MKLTYKLAAVATLTVGFAQAATFSLPDYQQFTLDNGLTVMLMEQNEVPLIEARLVVKAGAVDDGKFAGLAQLTADNLAFGSEQLAKADLEQQLDFIGATLATSADLDSSEVAMSFAAKDQATVLPLLRDLVVTPRFDGDEFNKYQQRYSQQLKQAQESPRAVIQSYYAKLIYGNHPYGNPVAGTLTSVTGIKLADLKTFHKQYYQPNNAALVLTGDFDAASMKVRIKALFDPWQGKAVARTTLPAVSTPSEARVMLVDKPDAREATFLIGSTGMALNNPDRVPTTVINTILGGRFTSWLNDELRVNSGLTYGARSSFAQERVSGTFAISTFTKLETAEQTIDLALQTYQKLWNKGVDKPTLDSAKAYVKGQFPPRYETAGQLADLLTSFYVYDIDKSFINNFQGDVDKLTVNSSKAIIDQHFPRNNLQFVIIGNAEQLRDKVKKYGKVREVKITDQPKVWSM